MRKDDDNLKKEKRKTSERRESVFIYAWKIDWSSLAIATVRLNFAHLSKHDMSFVICAELMEDVRHVCRARSNVQGGERRSIIPSRKRYNSNPIPGGPEGHVVLGQAMCSRGTWSKENQWESGRAAGKKRRRRKKKKKIEEGREEEISSLLSR